LHPAGERNKKEEDLGKTEETDLEKEEKSQRRKN